MIISTILYPLLCQTTTASVPIVKSGSGPRSSVTAHPSLESHLTIWNYQSLNTLWPIKKEPTYFCLKLPQKSMDFSVVFIVIFTNEHHVWQHEFYPPHLISVAALPWSFVDYHHYGVSYWLIYVHSIVDSCVWSLQIYFKNRYFKILHIWPEQNYPITEIHTFLNVCSRLSQQMRRV